MIPTFSRSWFVKTTMQLDLLIAPVSLQGLRHETPAGHMSITHLALDFRPRNQGRNRVDHHNIDCPTAHEMFRDLSPCSYGQLIREVVDVDAQPAGIHGIECVQPASIMAAIPPAR